MAVGHAYKIPYGRTKHHLPLDWYFLRKNYSKKSVFIDSATKRYRDLQFLYKTTTRSFISHVFGKSVRLRRLIYVDHLDIFKQSFMGDYQARKWLFLTLWWMSHQDESTRRNELDNLTAKSGYICIPTRHSALWTDLWCIMWCLVIWQFLLRAFWSLDNYPEVRKDRMSLIESTLIEVMRKCSSS